MEACRAVIEEGWTNQRKTSMSKKKDILKLLVSDSPIQKRYSVFFVQDLPARNTRNVTKASIYSKNLSQLLEDLQAAVQTLAELALLESQLNKQELSQMATTANSVEIIKEVILEKFGPRPR